MTIGNYHFFRNRNKFFIYDMLNNLLLFAKNETDYKILQDILERFSMGKNITLEERRKYKLILSNFSDIRSIVNSEDFLNKNMILSTKLTLMLAQTCNLKCKYCYGDEGRFGTCGEYMSKETAEQSIRYLVNRFELFEINESVPPHYYITFFGGEPLINFEVMKHVIEFVEQEYPDKSFSYTFTTNGTLFTKKNVDFLKNKNISILISIDGTKEIHDANRIFRNGRGSFEKVMANIALLKKNNMKFSVRATLSNEFFKYYETIIPFFSKLGAQRTYIARLNKYDIDSLNFDLNIDELKQDAKYISAYANKTKKRILKGERPDYIPFLTILQRIHEATDSLMSCGFMKGTTAVACNGDMYPCHRFVGIDGFKFGNVYNGFDDNALKKIAKNIDVATIECNSCWAKYICKRGCLRDIAKNHGCFIRFDKRYCDLQRKSIELALETFHELIKFQPDFIKELSNKEIEIYNIV